MADKNDIDIISKIDITNGSTLNILFPFKREKTNKASTPTSKKPNLGNSNKKGIMKIITSSKCIF